MAFLTLYQVSLRLRSTALNFSVSGPVKKYFHHTDDDFQRCDNRDRTLLIILLVFFVVKGFLFSCLFDFIKQNRN